MAKSIQLNTNLIKKNRLDHLENEVSDNGHLAYMEAVLTWQQLGIKDRSVLAYRSNNDIDLILNIYRKFFNYDVDLLITL